MSKPIIVATPELLGAFGADSEANVHFIGDKIDATILTVKNTENEVNLALPYYTTDSKRIDNVSDESLEDASGGGYGAYGGGGALGIVGNAAGAAVQATMDAVPQIAGANSYLQEDSVHVKFNDLPEPPAPKSGK